MDYSNQNPHFSSPPSFHNASNIDNGNFPFYKTKIMKSSRKTMEESNNNSFINYYNINEREQISIFNDTRPYTNVQTIAQTERSSDLTPLRDQEIINFSESIKSPHYNQTIFLENDSKENLLKKMENLENSLNQLKAQNQKYKNNLVEHEKNEKKLKEYVQNLLDVNNKLSNKLKEKELKENIINESQGFHSYKVLSDNTNSNNGNVSIEKLEKQLKDAHDERDYLHDKITGLNQKLDGMMKRDMYKEKTLDFYKNRIKLYQFKLENYPKSEKEQIKYLEEYIMGLLGENSKINKALEKSETESKKWQDKYFDFEKTKEVLVSFESGGRDKANDIAKKSYNANDIHDKEKSASKKDDVLFWGCKPKNK